MPASVSW